MQKREACKLPDSQLIELAIKNHPVAIAELIDRHKGMVFNLSYRILKNYHDAEEASQDTFIKAFRALKNFRSDSLFSTWLYTICFNTCMTRKMKDLNRKELFNELSIQEHPFENPTMLIEEKESKELVLKAVNELDAEDAAIVTLFYVNDLPTAEISKIVNLSEANVRVRLHRARKQLKERFTRIIGNQTTFQQTISYGNR